MTGSKRLQVVPLIALLLIVGVTSLPAQSVELKSYETAIRKGNYTGVEQKLIRYAIQNPKEAKPIELLGRIRLKQGRLNEAKSLFSRALILDAGLVTARISLAETHRLLGERQEAAKVLQAIETEKLPSEQTRLAIAEGFLSIGDCESALRIVGRLRPIVRNSDALPLRASCSLKSGESDKVDPLVPLATRLGTRKVEVALRFSEVLIDSGLEKKAIPVLSSFARRVPRNPKVALMLAKVELRTNKIASAERRLTRLTPARQTPRRHLS